MTPLALPASEVLVVLTLEVPPALLISWKAVVVETTRVSTQRAKANKKASTKLITLNS